MSNERQMSVSAPLWEKELDCQTLWGSAAVRKPERNGFHQTVGFVLQILIRIEKNPSTTQPATLPHVTNSGLHFHFDRLTPRFICLLTVAGLSIDVEDISNFQKFLFRSSGSPRKSMFSSKASGKTCWEWLKTATLLSLPSYGPTPPLETNQLELKRRRRALHIQNAGKSVIFCIKFLGFGVLLLRWSSLQSRLLKMALLWQTLKQGQYNTIQPHFEIKTTVFCIFFNVDCCFP